MLNLFNLLREETEEATKPELSHSTALMILILGIICVVAAIVLVYFFVLHVKRVGRKEKENAEQFRRAFWWDEPMKFWSFYVYAFMIIALILGFIACMIMSIQFL